MSVSYPLPGTPFFDRVRDRITGRGNWVDSADLAMLYDGPFPTSFYHLLHSRLHAEFRLRKARQARGLIATLGSLLFAGKARQAAALLRDAVNLPLLEMRLEWARRRARPDPDALPTRPFAQRSRHALAAGDGGGPLNATRDLYLAVREREGRLYSDDVVARLPIVDGTHPHHGEWRARQLSSRRLLTHLAARPGGLHILDLGCGNGWLTAALAQLPGSRVTGLDINGRELAQASRVFGSVAGASFLAADVFRSPLPAGAFDVVVMASVAQYFNDLALLLEALRTLLRPDGGEVHILDSPFYGEEDVQAARERSAVYYEGIGFPEMSARYHHHTWGELGDFDLNVLYDPRAVLPRFRRRLGAHDPPFPWLRVRFPS